MRLAGMTRVAVIAACLLAVGGAALAQTPDLDQARLQVLQQQLEIAQVQALEAQRAVNAVQEQLRTEQTLRALEAGRQGAVPAPLPYTSLPYASLPYTPAPYASLPNALALGSNAGGVVAPIEDRHAADSDRLLQLQGEAMARSNARILAVRPAL
jgi:hypothetical protein